MTNIQTPTASVTFDRSELADAIAMACRVVEKRNTIPILSTVLIEPAGPNAARMVATDLDCEIAITLSATWADSAAFTLDAHTLSATVKRMAKGALVQIDVGADGRAAIVAGGVRFAMRADRVAADFPRIAGGFANNAKHPTVAAFVMPSQAVRTMLMDAAPFVSTEETRYYLNGVFLNVNAGALVATATNGHTAIFTRYSLPIGAETLSDKRPGSCGNPGAIVPRKACGLVARFIAKDASDETALRFTDGGSGHVTVAQANWRIVSKLIDGTFPECQRVIPTVEPLGIWEASADELAAFGKASGQGNAKGATIALALSEGGVRSSVTVAGETATAGAPGSYVGAPYATGIASRYLADVAAAFPSGSVVSIDCHPVVAKGAKELQNAFCATSSGAPGRTVVVMPVRAEFVEPVAPLYPVVTAPVGRAASLFDVHSGIGGGETVVPVGPRQASPKEIWAYLSDYAARSGLPNEGDCPDIIWSGNVGGLAMPYGATFETYSVPMPGRHQSPVTLDVLDDAGDVVTSSVIAETKKGLAIDADAVQAASGIVAAAKVRAVRKSTRKAVAPAVVAVAEPETVAPDPVAIETVAPVAEIAPSSVSDAVAPVVVLADPVDASSGPEIALPVPSIDVAALLDAVAALSARVASLETRPPVVTAGARLDAATARRAHPARRVAVQMYLRHRAMRDAIREERAAFVREIAEARAQEELAFVQAANARRAATDYRHEMDRACRETDQLRAKRRASATRIIATRAAARRALVVAARDAEATTWARMVATLDACRPGPALPLPCPAPALSYAKES